MNETLATVKTPRKISLIWFLPIVVLIIGGWVTAKYYASKGPLVEIALDTAEGLEVGRTRVRALSVDVGVVEDIELVDNLDGVIVTARLNPGTRHLLDQDTNFWVVRPRVSAEGVSGLGTLLSGAYIELSPGKSGKFKRNFTALDNAPPARPGVAGVRVVLLGDSAASVSTGAPVLYRGLRVGRVESVALSEDNQELEITTFIEKPYDKILNKSARFWNASGLSISANADGVQVNMQSLSSLVSGGIAFSVVDMSGAASPLEPSERFRLFSSELEAKAAPYSAGAEYVLLFNRSLRGLSVGAPVEYRGIRVGTVKRILSGQLTERDTEHNSVSVIVRIEPGRIGVSDSQGAVAKVQDLIAKAVAEEGLRASLETGSFLTGELFVAFDYHPDAAAASVSSFDGYPAIPTVDTGLLKIEQQLSGLLTTLNAAPIEATVEEARKVLTSLRATSDSLNSLIGSEETVSLPANLNRSLQQLDAVLEETKDLVDTLGDKPNALIMPVEHQPDPQPRVKR